MSDNQNKGILSSFLGDINTNVGVKQSDVLKIGTTLFITGCLIILAYFSFKKLFS